jgi:hypothetical protein
VNFDAIEAQLHEIEALVEDGELSEADRTALRGASQALRNVLDPETWQPASHTFYRVGAPVEPTSSAGIKDAPVRVSHEGNR